MNEIIVCDGCGKQCVQKPNLAGYGMRADKPGLRYCYGCMNEYELETMFSSQTYWGYLSQDLQRITTFTGGHLIHIHAWERDHNFGGTMTYWRGKDSRGGVWYGKGSGAGMSTTMRRAKGG